MTKEPIAIIGIGCRFPGAENAAEFWQLLAEERDEVREIPTERSRRIMTSASDRSMRGGFLDSIDQFDARFFGISSEEAVTLDPHQRLLLEVTWQALEDAGQVPAALAGSQTGVFIGVAQHEYLQFLQACQKLSSTIATSISPAIAANRISYFFDLRGISLVVNTACSSGLVAVDLACHKLWNGEISLGIVGAANLILSPPVFQSGTFSAQGRCRTFDAEADGYVRGEGVGVVILKPLSRALADRDPIYAVIRGSAVNQDGRSNGLTAPNPQAQTALLEAAYACAGVSPSSIDYVEVHGTGTLIGDALELKALGSVLGNGRLSEQRCAIGSVKTNIGHTEAASGIASLIKVALALKHQQIPAHLHFQTPNPYLSFEQLPFVVPTKLMQFPQRLHRSRASVSAFGLGGTNAHVVLEAAELSHPQIVQNQLHILTLSAKSDAALRALAQRYLDFLEQYPATAIASLCFTANTRRTQFSHRLAMVATSIEEFSKQLQCFLNDQAVDGLFVGKVNSKLRQHKGLKESLIDLDRGCEVELIEQSNPTRTLEQAIFSLDHSQELQQQLIELWLQGVCLNWESLYAADQICVSSLPTYPFERQSFWLGIDSERLQESKLHHLCEDTDSIQSDTERAIAQIWSDLLCLESLPTDQSFFALGGTSMMAMQLLRELEQTFHKKLPLSSIFEAPTIQQLAQQIENSYVSPWYSLVPIQPQGSQPPLFGIHLLEYRALSDHLGFDQPIYGLRYGIAGKTIDHMPILPRRIEALAAHYIEEMRSIQPEGPYSLMGFSFGGRVALEMAQQLTACGQSVKLLVILDTFLSVQVRANSLQQQISATLQLKPDQIWQRFRSKLYRRYQRDQAIGFDQGYEPQQSHPYGEAHFFDRDLPRSYPGKVIFFQASDLSSGVFHHIEPPSERWRELALGGLEVYQMPGDHGAMLREPHVQLLAQHLQALLSQNLQMSSLH
jgi:acyl transferase domain-containing protein/thioesterase domain-containing protein